MGCWILKIPTVSIFALKEYARNPIFTKLAWVYAAYRGDESLLRRDIGDKGGVIL
jgi:hypothetical protein